MAAGAPNVECPGPDRHADGTGLVTVTVTYNPDPEILARQQQLLPPVALKVLVDNGSTPELRERIACISARHGAVLVQNDVNVGLAAALNQGARHARTLLPARRFLLLLDQDSEPDDGAVERLVARYAKIEALAGTACCIGPRLIDVQTNLEHGFHQQQGWLWIRRYPKSTSREPLAVANLNGSGTLMPFSLFEALGGLEEALFIDHVDTEWAFRVRAAGYGLYAVPDVSFRHRMGERSLRFWLFGWRVWPDRSPQRHYYLFRNTVRLMRRPYVPRVWKAWALLKSALTLLTHLLFDPARATQLRNMLAGVRDGLRREN